MIENTQTTSNNLVLQDGTRRNVNVFTMVSNDNHSTAKLHLGAKADITGNSQVVQFQDLRNGLETGQKVVDLLEVITQLDKRDVAEHTVRVDHETTVDKRVQVGGNQEQVRSRLDRQEASSGHIDTMGILEMLDGSTDSSFELDDLLALRSSLIVDNNFQVHSLFVHDTLDSLQVNPQVVGIENLELLYRLEILDVFVGNLSNFQETDMAIIINEGTTLNISLGLVGNFHDELGVGFNHVVENVEINSGTQVIDIGNKEVLFALSNQLVQETRVVDGLVQITVTRRIPKFCVSC